MNSQIKIGQRVLSKSSKPFIIAEAGINHNGDLDTAKKMVLVAKEAGCDAVKFQTFTAAEFCGDPTQMFTYTSQGKEVTEPMLDMFQRHEFSLQQWQELKEFCSLERICFLSTPQNVIDLQLLLSLDIDAIKVGSDDFTNIPLLKRYRKANLPMILSCGMSDLSEVHQALDALNVIHDPAPNVILCLCTSQYPTPATDINLNKLKTLEGAFPNIIKGFSDHSQGPLASSLAVAFGAILFEKHFTLDNQMSGPDHWFSENPESLKIWTDSIRTAHTMLGSHTVAPTKAEKKMRTLARRSIVALKDIKRGEFFSEENIGLRRPGNGLSPILFEEILGLKASRKIDATQLLQFGDFKHGT
ncbi:N-acetylneuraminate synthase family protein [Pseudoalteromonas sp. NBT06-2]|uniref:N-acetylneuraminate synthase family protein n=1 Tax=Pseudoalteromonas sp. NBT06-2 TaxID=2025950 RepID=UPI001483A7E4|nr:N-acetylneuraminate synthase family protein [Pseudoalteromonas sp. NBT06-2]